jgi:hypothetical protein
VATRTEKAGLIIGLILAVLLILFLLCPEGKKKAPAATLPEEAPKTPGAGVGLPGSSSQVPPPEDPPAEEEAGPEGGKLDQAPPEAGGDEEGGIFDSAVDLIKKFYGVSATSSTSREQHEGSGYGGTPVE